MYIVDDEQRRDRAGPSDPVPQHPCALRVAAVGRHLRRWRSSTMCTDIACVAPPCICLPTAATRHILILGQAPRTSNIQLAILRPAFSHCLNVMT